MSSDNFPPQRKKNLHIYKKILLYYNFLADFDK